MATRRATKAKPSKTAKVTKAPKSAKAASGKPGIHELVGRAIADERFRKALLENPETVLKEFSMPRAVKAQVLGELANPKRIESTITKFKERFVQVQTV